VWAARLPARARGEKGLSMSLDKLGIALVTHSPPRRWRRAATDMRPLMIATPSRECAVQPPSNFTVSERYHRAPHTLLVVEESKREGGLVVGAPPEVVEGGGKDGKEIKVYHQ
jgi:hypothetical protein